MPKIYNREKDEVYVWKSITKLAEKLTTVKPCTVVIQITAYLQK